MYMILFLSPIQSIKFKFYLKSYLHNTKHFTAWRTPHGLPNNLFRLPTNHFSQTLSTQQDKLIIENQLVPHMTLEVGLRDNFIPKQQAMKATPSSYYTLINGNL